MGHSEYLDDAYLRLEESGEIAQVYKEAMPNVSVYAVEDQQLREQTSVIEQENIDLNRRMKKLELVVERLQKLLEA